MNITVVGMGKIGLPIAVQFATKGHKVFGADINARTIDLINSGVEPFPGEADLQTRLSDVILSGNLIGTVNTKEATSKSDVVVVVVPLLVDEEGLPVFDAIDSATQEIAKGLNPKTLILYETTLPVGTTRNRFAKIIESESGLSSSSDFYLAFSPERVFTGRIFADLRKYPKLIGGINPESGTRAAEFYSQVLDFEARDDLNVENGVWDLGSTEAAELAKLAETTYRFVNIGLANQFAKFADRLGIEFEQILRACNSQPFSHIHDPGIAVGGHCIPVYPNFYLLNDTDATIVREARNINSGMPDFFVTKLEKIHGSIRNQKIAILGAAFRDSVKETAFSGAFQLALSLEKRGGIVVVHDPLYTDQELMELGFNSYKLGTPIDALILHTSHSEYLKLTTIDFPGVKSIVDGRNFLKAENFAGVKFSKFGVS